MTRRAARRRLPRAVLGVAFAAVLVAMGGEQLGEATTVIAGIVQSTDQRGSTGEARDRRIVTLRATLTVANRGNEAPRP